MSRSFFGLVNRLRETSPQVEKWNRLACLEMAEQAYVSTMARYPKIKLLEIASGPPVGKYQTPEQFLAQVHERAWVAEVKCSKAELQY